MTNEDYYFWNKGMLTLTRLNFNLQILAKHGSKDDIVGEQKFRSIKLILTIYFDLSVKYFSTGRTSAAGFLKFTMSCVVINILSQK